MMNQVCKSLVLTIAFLFVAACQQENGQSQDTAASEDSAPQTTSAPTKTVMRVPDLQGQEIRIGVENAYLPFNYLPLEGGTATGWDYEAWGMVCEIINCTPVFVETPWVAMIDKVSSGELDAAGNGITVTDERMGKLAFSDGYLSIDQRLLVRVGEIRFFDTDGFKDDENLILGAQPGTTNFDAAIDLVGTNRVATYRSFSGLMDALLAGDVDAIVMDERAGQGYIGAQAELVNFIGEPLSSDKLAFAFPKQSDLVEPVNYALARLDASGRLDALAHKYFSDEFTITYDLIQLPEEEVIDDPSAAAAAAESDEDS